MCIFTCGEFTGYYCFLKRFYGLADIPTIFQKRIDKTLEIKLARLDAIIIVTKGSAENINGEKGNDEETGRIRTQIEPEKMRVFRKKAEWIGHKIDQNGIQPLQDKLEAITKIEIPKNEKELTSFLGAIQYLPKYVENLSAQTDILTKLLKKNKISRYGHPNKQKF